MAADSGAAAGAQATCRPWPAGPLDAASVEQMAVKLKALADPVRLRLLSHIAARGSDPVCACELLDVVEVSQPTVSHHLKKLVDAGLLTREQRGKWAHYTVVREAFGELRGFLDLRGVGT
ncbi:metalloregulator ArsR/SmtB family transcription factor [Dietzia maris]|nr:metalloregulator ArsR/SmtB family transcription factor [Dietzia maris]MCZ4539153.1 metalloregulator ArsR/SmtB family transcription factor [Dietzia maris]